MIVNRKKELDYEREADDQTFFKNEFERRKMPVKVLAVYEKYTSQRVISSEWVDGVKLADAIGN